MVASHTSQRSRGHSPPESGRIHPSTRTLGRIASAGGTRGFGSVSTRHDARPKSGATVEKQAAGRRGGDLGTGRSQGVILVFGVPSPDLIFCNHIRDYMELVTSRGPMIPRMGMRPDGLARRLSALPPKPDTNREPERLQWRRG